MDLAGRCSLKTPVPFLRILLMMVLVVRLCSTFRLIKKPLARMQCEELCRKTGGCVSYAARQRDLSCHLRFVSIKRRFSRKDSFNEIPSNESCNCSIYSKVVKPKIKTKQAKCVYCMARVTGEQGYCHCLKGWTYYARSCYRVFKKKTAWNGAIKTCRNRGGYLADIANNDERVFIKTLVKKVQPTTENIWLGGTDERKEGVWRWRHTGDRIPPLKWCKGQPDNGIIRQNCLAMSSKSDLSCDWDWDDDTCFLKYNMLCEARPRCKDPC